MKTDVQGCSTCPRGSEQYEYFQSFLFQGGVKVQYVQYDYRAAAGQLFSCVAKSLEDARARRDAWLKGQAEQ